MSLHDFIGDGIGTGLSQRFLTAQEQARMARRQAMIDMPNHYFYPGDDPFPKILEHTNKPLTFIEELQKEVDEWLSDVK